MDEHRVAGLTAASSATDNNAVAILWNPHASRHIWVVEIAFHNDTAAAGKVTLTRTTTRGTAGSTVTPDADNNVEGITASPAGALLDLSSFSVEPTKASPDLGGFQSTATIGAGKVWSFRARPIRIAAGTGFGLINGAAAAVAASWVEFTWQE
jgi:hypothetical protein